MTEHPRLAGRDRGDLPDGAILRFEAISRGKDPQNDHRLVLFDDGRTFVAWHGDERFGDKAFGDEPAAVLGAGVLDEVRGLLADARLEDGPAHRVDPALEGGMWRIVTARGGDGRVCEVVFEGVPSPLADRMQQLASEVAG